MSGRPGNDETDAALVHAAATGDADALETLFRRHHAPIHALCSRLLGSADAADDAVQETFLRVARYGRRFEGRSTFSTWLYRIARNACHDLRASDERTARRDAAWAEDHNPSATPDSHDPRLNMLEAALARLPTGAREVLVLTRHLDLSCDDLAHVLGCTPGAARVRVHRAIARLREICHELERNAWTANEPSKH